MNLYGMGSCFVLVAPSSQYEQMSFSTVLVINGFLRMPKIIRFGQGM